MELAKTKWLMAPDRLELETGEVHLWRIALEAEPSVYRESLKLLSTDEQERAGRYRFQKDRECFVVGRAAIRKILGRYIGISPASLRFSYTQFGKPILEPADPIRFNLAHSRGLALLAVANEIELGIDVEYVDENYPFAEVAPSCFSPAELTAFNSAQAERSAQAFFSGWTRKEAFIKALGQGLSCPLKSFTVSLDPGAADDLLISTNGDAGTWSLISLDPGPDHAAALASDQPLRSARCLEWPNFFAAKTHLRASCSAPSLRPARADENTNGLESPFYFAA